MKLTRENLEGAIGWMMVAVILSGIGIMLFGGYKPFSGPPAEVIAKSVYVLALAILIQGRNGNA
jgi:hypothetical protein